MLGVYSHLVLFVVGYLASFLFKRPPAPKTLTLYGWRERLARREAQGK
jgi:SSS family solute:Na+ symporter